MSFASEALPVLQQQLRPEAPLHILIAGTQHPCRRQLLLPIFLQAAIPSPSPTPEDAPQPLLSLLRNPQQHSQLQPPLLMSFASEALPVLQQLLRPEAPLLILIAGTQRPYRLL